MSASDNDRSVYESKRSERNKHKSKRPLTQTAYQKQHQQSSEKKTQTENGAGSQNGQNNNYRKKRNVEICGDSMTKHLQAYRIGRSTNERVVSKSFSGATFKNLKHYIVPTLEKKPDELILHIGTNDLKDSAPKEIVRDIMALKEFVSSQTKVTISELVLRTNDKKLNDKVKNVNELLKKSCNNNNLSMDLSPFT